MTDDWQEVACMPLPDFVVALNDEEVEDLRREVEDACIDAFLKLIDGN